MTKINYNVMYGLTFNDGMTITKDYTAYFSYKLTTHGLEIGRLRIKADNPDMAYGLFCEEIEKDCARHGVELLVLPYYLPYMKGEGCG